ncbi:MAG: YlmC/YmxH family sporulation protein [Ruminococcaceae bacterium]|nr:YlmC/YmxH family sporulation protein [Oscillospiraceae bacterium]
MACNTNSLSSKLVINVCDARRLGHICNYEIDLCEGRITAVFVPGEGGFWGLSRNSEIRIPWDKIRKIGEDAILVELPVMPGECKNPPQKKKWFW